MPDWNAQKTAATVGRLAFLFWLVSAAIAAAQGVNTAFDEIDATANRLCDAVRAAGTTESAEVKSTVRAQLDGLSRTIQALGVPGTRHIPSNAYRDLLQRDLKVALLDRQRCRFDVFMALQAKLVPDVSVAQAAPAAQPPPDEERRAVPQQPVLLEEPAAENPAASRSPDGTERPAPTAPSDAAENSAVSERPPLAERPKVAERPVLAEQSAPPQSPSPQAGLLRARSIFIHHRAGSAEGQATAADFKQQLDALARYTEIRAVQVLPSTPSVRYFYQEDADAARYLARLLEREGGHWTVKAFTTYEPRPRPGLLEIWIPARQGP